MTDELYPIDQVEWNNEQTLFKQLMRVVVYRTENIYFDGVKDTEDESAVLCQLWTGEPLPSTGETMSWYAVSKDYLRNLDFEALIEKTKAEVEKIRDDHTAFWQSATTEDQE